MIQFTKEEKTVLIFILVMLFTGTAVLYCKKTNQAPDRLMESGESHISEKYQEININTASMGELMQLKHIGPVLAERIIAYREEQGPFRKTKDIKNVKGIGDKTYEDIKKHITLE